MACSFPWIYSIPCPSTAPQYLCWYVFPSDTAGSLIHTLSQALALPEWLINASIAAADSPAHALLLLAQHSSENLDHLLRSLALPPATTLVRFDSMQWMPMPITKILYRRSCQGPTIHIVARTEHVALWLDGREVRQPPARIARAVNTITNQHRPVVLVASPAHASSPIALLPQKMS